MDRSHNKQASAPDGDGLRRVLAVGGTAFDRIVTSGCGPKLSLATIRPYMDLIFAIRINRFFDIFGGMSYPWSNDVL